MSSTTKACPICGRPVQPKTMPFCSTRCADADLGHWLAEDYRVPDSDDEPDNDDEP